MIAANEQTAAKWETPPRYFPLDGLTHDLGAR